jgi:fructose-bisphosphate aldolase class II
VTLSSAAELVADAVARGRAVPAFNVITLEHAEAIAEGAGRTGTGVIMQFSENAIRFHGGDPRPILLAARAVAEAAATPIALHLDHIEDAALIDLAITQARAWGLGSLMVDASRLGYRENVAATADAVRRAHDVRLWVEAELGEIGGKDGAHAPGVRTDPEEAAAFAAETGVDGLAVAVGSSHAMRERTAGVDADLVARIAALAPVPLVLHGSSGVDDDGIRAAVAAGIRKVNVGTALNLAGTAALRAALAEHPEAVDPRPFTAASRAAMADVVEHFCRVIAG